MMFSTRQAKFGKGENLSAIMNSNNQITIYYFEQGITKKELSLINNTYNLTREKTSMGYKEVIPLSNNFFVTRLEKSIGIIKYEK